MKSNTIALCAAAGLVLAASVGFNVSQYVDGQKQAQIVAEQSTEIASLSEKMADQATSYETSIDRATFNACVNEYQSIAVAAGVTFFSRETVTEMGVDFCSDLRTDDPAGFSERFFNDKASWGESGV